MGRLAADRSGCLEKFGQPVNRKDKTMSETHFPLDESKLPFKIPKDHNPRE